MQDNITPTEVTLAEETKIGEVSSTEEVSSIEGSSTEEASRTEVVSRIEEDRETVIEDGSPGTKITNRVFRRETLRTDRGETFESFKRRAYFKPDKFTFMWT